MPASASASPRCCQRSCERPSPPCVILCLSPVVARQSQLDSPNERTDVHGLGHDEADGGFGRLAGVAVVVGIAAAVIAGATMWLLLTDPVTVANAIEDGEISPLIRQLADVIANALATLLDYL